MSLRQRNAAAKRAKILSAAREILAERGFSLDMIALTRRARVGSGTVYRYFQGKEAIIQAVVDELVARSRADLTKIARTSGDARTDVRRTMMVGFTRVAEYGQLTIALLAGAPCPVRPFVERRELETFFRRLLARGVAQGHFRADLDIDYAVSVWFALVAPQALGSLLPDRSVDQMAAETTEFFLAGIAR